jgi:hypothetical protein
MREGITGKTTGMIAELIREEIDEIGFGIGHCLCSGEKTSDCY